MADGTRVRPILPYAFARQHGVVLDGDAGGPVCALRPDAAVAALVEARRIAGPGLRYQPLDREAFEARMAATYRDTAADASDAAGADSDLSALADATAEVDDLLDQSGDAPVVRLINALLLEAIKENASDIHIETQERRLVVRFRIDGFLREMVVPKRALAPLLVSRIKVMARLDIAEKRMPQDGRVSLRVGRHEVDVRVSTIPSQYGERVVMRLLDRSSTRLGLDRLGMSGRDLRVFTQLLARPDGMLLVTGPTGSGKTTSLYAALDHLNDQTRNIMTVEDPIEYDLDGVGQTQVNARIEMTFARALRAILRQDPDVIMIGEIRDLETAQIAVQASLTGHLVLAPLHTNDSVGAVTRLVDMGIEPFLVASSLLGVLAQRLVRRLCPHCRRAHTPDAAECRMLQINPVEAARTPVYTAAGCEACNHTGYQGRTGIFELLQIDEPLRAQIHDGAAETRLREHARLQGMMTIREDGLRWVRAGHTSIEEVLRVTRE